jgi:mannosyl-oligosaccharide alpha-1,2-mannosidase
MSVGKSAGVWEERRERVRQAAKDAWQAYRLHAFGSDEFLPLSKRGMNTSQIGVGYFIVDTLDTLLLMNLTKEVEEARKWTSELSFDVDVDVNVFEATIRMLGGLLSTYMLTVDDLYLRKAIDLGERLLHAFHTPTGVPVGWINLHTHKHGKQSSNNQGIAVTAQVATLQLEMRYLSHLTGDMRYWHAVEQVMDVLERLAPVDGLVPAAIHIYTPKFEGEEITLGARTDSYYEYLLKQWIQTNGTETRYIHMYDRAIRGIHEQLLSHTIPNGFVFISERYFGEYVPRMEHLACFLPGSLALAYHYRQHETTKHVTRGKMLETAEALLKTCTSMYERMPCGLAPETTHFFDGTDGVQPEAGEHDMYANSWDGGYLLRPQVVESLYVMYKVTGNSQHRESAWRIFENIEKHARLPNDADGRPAGYASVADVTKVPVRLMDKMDSYFLASGAVTVDVCRARHSSTSTYSLATRRPSPSTASSFPPKATPFYGWDKISLVLFFFICIALRQHGRPMEARTSARPQV